MEIPKSETKIMFPPDTEPESALNSKKMAIAPMEVAVSSYTPASLQDCPLK